MDEVSKTITNIIPYKINVNIKITKILQVDIDNVEDLNELEARLYAQIHHEATDVPIGEHIKTTQVSENKEQDSVKFSNFNSDVEPNYQTSVYTNKVLSRRYWSKDDNVIHQRNLEYQQNNKQRLIRNPLKTTDQINPQAASGNKSQNQSQIATHMEIETTHFNNTIPTNENLNAKQDNNSNVITGRYNI